MRSFILFFVLLVVCSVGYAEVAPVSDPLAGLNIPSWVFGLLGLIAVIIDFILGKTSWIKPNSILDVIFQIIGKVLKLFIPGPKN